MAAGLTLSRQDDAVVWAVIDRGPENLLTSQICQELTEFLQGPPADVHVLVLAPAGANFCLGRERQAATLEELRREVGALVALNGALQATRVVTMAAVNGDAAGFGVGLASLCDVSIAVPSARFWFPEVELNLAPAVVLAWLPRIVGRRRAFQLTATGQRLSAGEALDLGLLTGVATADDALESAVRNELAALTKFSPRVHGEIKDFLRASAGLGPDQANDLAIEKLINESMSRAQATAVTGRSGGR